MTFLRQRPVAIAALFMASAIGGVAVYVARHRQVPPPAVAVASQDIAVVLSTLKVQLTAQTGADRNVQYQVAIEVEGDRRFTMPVRFVREMQPATVTPDQASVLTEAWVKARATGIAQFGVVTPDHGPYLLIDVDSPGAR